MCVCVCVVKIYVRLCFCSTLAGKYERERFIKERFDIAVCVCAHADMCACERETEYSVLVPSIARVFIHNAHAVHGDCIQQHLNMWLPW